MTDTEPRRRSRLPWPQTTEPTTTPAGTHDHQLKNTPLGMAFLGIVLLFLVCVGLVAYVIIAKQNRDAAQEQVQREIHDQLCAILDGLPEGGVLDLTRDKLGCGPGLPLSSFSPDEQAKLNPPAVPPSVPAQQPDAAPVPPVEPPPAPEQPPAADTPAPLPGGADGPPATSAPPPLSPPSQVRQLVCDLLPICPKATP